MGRTPARAWTRGVVLAAFCLGCSTLPVTPQPLVHYSGRIMDSKGRPIPGGHFTFRSVTRPASVIQPWDAAEIDTAGSFQVDLYPGTYRVAWDPYFYTSVYRDDKEPDRTIEVSADHATLEWVVEGVVVQGTVKDPSGAAVDSFGIYVGHDRYSANTFTYSGRYELFLAPSSYTFHVYGRYGAGIPSQTFGPVSVQSDTTLNFQIDGAELTGAVRGPGSIPLAGAVVQARGELNNVTARTDAAGSYRMFLPPQDVRFLVSPIETWILPRLTTRVTVAGPSSIDFDLDGTEWTGVVTRSDTGAPVPDATVSAVLIADALDRVAWAMTDASGQFHLAVEAGREYEMFAAMNDLQSARISRVAAADTSFALEIAVPTP